MERLLGSTCDGSVEENGKQGCLHVVHVEGRFYAVGKEGEAAARYAMLVEMVL